MGDVRADLFPSPGLVVLHVVFLESSNPTHVLAAVNGIHLDVEPQTFLEGRLKIRSVRFTKPRFIFHRERKAQGKPYWSTLAMPQGGATNDNNTVDQWDVRNGSSLEIWNHTVKPTSKWVFEGLSGTYRANAETAAVAGSASTLGPKGMVDLHYDKKAVYPITAHLSHVALTSGLSETPREVAHPASNSRRCSKSTRGRTPRKAG